MADQSCMFLRTKDVRELTGWSQSTLHRRIADGSFPKPIKIGPGTGSTKMKQFAKAEIHRWRERIEEQGGET